MALDEAALDALFRTARTHERFSSDPVSEETLRQLYELVKWGPTSANSSPARFVFIRSESARDKLRGCLSLGNVEKTMAAPVTVIVAYDPTFYRKLPDLYPDMDIKTWFSGNPDLAEDTATRNSTLQGGYLIMAARSLGLACGPMSGFNRNKLERVFFEQSGWRANFLINLGYPQAEAELPPRLPRLDFDEAAIFA